MINGLNLIKIFIQIIIYKIKLIILNYKKFISIHVRSTDRVVKFKNIFSQIQLKDMIIDFHLKKFPDMITDLILKYSNCKNIYVSSDQEHLKNKIIHQLKVENFKVYYNKNAYKNSNYRRTGGMTFL